MTYLAINTQEGDRYYLFIQNPDKLKAGDYVEIFQGETDTNKSKHYVSAPDSIIILREALMEKIGGLEEVLKRIKEGKPILENKQGREN